MFLFEWITGPTAESLCRALAHSLWQGILLGTIVWFLLRGVPRHKPQLRYILSLFAFYSLLLSVCVTWSLIRFQNTTQANSSSRESVKQTPENPPHSISALPLTAQPSVPTRETLSDSAQSVFPHVRTFNRLSPWVMPIWLMGTFLFLLRASRSIAAAHQIQLGKQITDPPIIDLLNQITNKLQLRVPVRLFSAQGLVTPCVIGILKPTILIPTSLISSLTLEQWEAILAHELAHVRRWDYLTNITQLVIEALLFFNPATWFLTRQVRIEREACCDANAIQITKRPIEYAQILFNLAERFSNHAPTYTASTSFSEPRSGSLVERIQRILSPTKASGFNLKWPFSLGFLTICLVVLGLLQTGSDLVVALTAEMLNDEKRVEVLTKTAQDSNAKGLFDEIEQSTTDIILRGTVTVANQKTPQEKVFLNALTTYKKKGSIKSSNRYRQTINLSQQSKFEGTAPPGNTWISVVSDNFAPQYVGPYGAKHAPIKENIQIILQKGVTIPVEVVDENGEPVPDAIISVTPNCPGGNTSTGNRREPITDSNGKAQLEHVNIGLEYSFLVKAKGFQYSETAKRDRIRLTPNQTTRLEIRRARPISGTVLNNQGSPIPNASIKVFSRRSDLGATHLNNRLGKVLTTTNPHGKFQVTNLADDSTYILLIESDDYAPTITQTVRPGDENLNYTLDSAVQVNGSIHLSSAIQENQSSPSNIRWKFTSHPAENSNPLSPRSLNTWSVSSIVIFNKQQAISNFSLPPLPRGKLSFWLNGKELKQIELTKPVHNVELHTLASQWSPKPPETRWVEVAFYHGSKQVFPRGKVYDSDAAHWGIPCPEDKAVTFKASTGKMLHLNSNNLIGFWFNGREQRTEIPPGKGVFKIKISVEPAGAITGTVLNNDGTPVSDARISTFCELSRGFLGTRKYTSTPHATTNSKGEFFVTPVPLGAKCSLKLQAKEYLQLLGKLEMKPENLLPTYDVKINKTTNATVQLVNPEGEPVVGAPVILNCTHPKMRWRNISTKVTNPNGECTFTNLNPNLKGYYAVQVTFPKGTRTDLNQPQTPLKLNGTPTQIHLNAAGQVSQIK